MKSAFRLLLLSLLALVVMELSGVMVVSAQNNDIPLWLGGAMVVSTQENDIPDKAGREDSTICYLPSYENTGTHRFKLAVVDLVSLDETPGSQATNLPKQIENNLDRTGLFQGLDKRAFLETDLRAGLDPESKPDYRAWSRIATDFLIKGAISESNSRLTLDLRLFDVPNERQMLGKRFQGKSGEASKMINQFSNAVLEAMTGVPGVFGSQIIFVAGDKSAKSIMMAELGSDEVVEIAGHEGGPCTQPTMGPDGRMAWIHRNANKWELLVDGKLISSGPSHLSPAFKPDGTVAAAYHEQSGTVIYTFTSQGDKTFLTGEGGINVSPTFSPDGSRMAFVSDSEGSAAVYVSSAEGGPATRLTDNGKATDPAWSPTGEYIAFVSRETDIFIVRPDGSGLRQLTGHQGRNYRPSFSPDGRMIVFASDRNGRMQLFVMAVNGDRQQPLLPDYQASQDSPYWSPTMPENY